MAPRQSILVLLLALVAQAAACATAQPMVEVGGKDLDLTQLAGKWEGTYVGRDSGRSGTVLFDLVAGYRSAEGKVVMNAVGDPAHAQELHLKFIEVAGRKVSGTIEPYTDPACKCTVETTFVGSFGARTMEGTFTTRPTDGSAAQAGTWSATRQK
jgi:hypothetical protein